MPDVGFHVKIRPFLAEFIRKLYDEKKFEVHYYTAGTRSYGTMIIDIFRIEIDRLYGRGAGENGDPNILQKMNDILSH